MNSEVTFTENKAKSKKKVQTYNNAVKFKITDLKLIQYLNYIQ